MSATSLSAALAELGLRCDVEERGKLGIIVLAPSTDPALSAGRSGLRMTPDVRRKIASLARAHGFTNVCVEIQPGDASLSGD